jgi:hypothetical protein
LKPIYLPPKKEFSGLQKEFKLFLVGSKILPKIQTPVWKDLHPSTRMGPNGPALNNATFDFPLFMQRYSYIFTKIKGISKLALYLTEFGHTFHHWKVNPKPMFKTSPILRRLSTVDDKEGKLRVIGIADY